ncbi:MAG: hypothetical protein ACI91R_001780 [Vicingaceae bacterium]|jgi:hypothetical protein
MESLFLKFGPLAKVVNGANHFYMNSQSTRPGGTRGGLDLLLV